MQKMEVTFTANSPSHRDCHKHVPLPELLESQNTISSCPNTAQFHMDQSTPDNHQTTPTRSPQMALNLETVSTSAQHGSDLQSYGTRYTYDLSPSISLSFGGTIPSDDKYETATPSQNIRAEDISQHVLNEGLQADVDSVLDPFAAAFDQFAPDSWQILEDSWPSPLLNQRHSSQANGMYASAFQYPWMLTDGASDNEAYAVGCHLEATSKDMCLSPSDHNQMSDCFDVKPLLHIPETLNASATSRHSSARTRNLNTHAQPMASSGRIAAYHEQTFASSIDLQHCFEQGINNCASDPGLAETAIYPPLPDLKTSIDWDTYTLDPSLATNNSQWTECASHSAQDVFSFANYNVPGSSLPNISIPGGSRSISQYGVPLISTSFKQCSQSRRGSDLRDKTKDSFLLQCKARGMSYKEIKAKGGFEEPESTLRGRYRTLMKPKEARVRKPAWSEIDVAILKETVAKFLCGISGNSLTDSSYPNRHGSRAQLHALNRVSWKQVAESMANRGCYRFGNATVKKKYLEAMGIVDTAHG